MSFCGECDWDSEGFPGEYVFGEYVYIPEFYMDERWKRDGDAPDYFVSNKGRVWSTISDSFIYGTPTGRCGHIDVSLKVGKRKIRKYVHRMVAEAFIPNPHNFPEVRHLDDDPSNNCVWNLVWGTQADNMQDAIRNGHFRFFTDEDREAAMQKRRDPVVAVNLITRDELYFDSQQEAARTLGLEQSCISSVIRGRSTNVSGYYFYRPGEGCRIDLDSYNYSRHGAFIVATDLETGERSIFKGQTEAAKSLGMSVSAVSMCLSGKMRSAKGYRFEYALEEDVYGA